MIGHSFCPILNLNGAGSVKIDRLIAHSFCPVLNLNGAGSVKIGRLIGHSFCPVLNINCTGSGKADFGDFNNGVCDVMKIAIAESNSGTGLVIQYTLCFSPDVPDVIPSG